MSGSQPITWPMPPMLCEISTFITPLPLPHTIQVTYDGEDPLRRGVMSEYDPAYWTPCFSDASPKLFCILTHCVLDSTCYTTLHHPLHPHLSTCHLSLLVSFFPLPDCFH